MTASEEKAWVSSTHQTPKKRTVTCIQPEMVETASFFGPVNFLEVDVPSDRWPSILDHCSFEYMKSHAELVAPLGGAIFKGGAQEFIFKGTNGRWRDQLTPQDVEAYEARALDELGPECARWLATGEMSAAV